MRHELRILTAALAAVSVTWALAATSHARVADAHPLFGCRIPAGALAGKAHHVAPPTRTSGVHADDLSGAAVALLVLAVGIVAVVAVRSVPSPRRRAHTA